MKFDGSELPGRKDNSVASVIEITPSLIRKEREDVYRSENNEESYSILRGTPAPYRIGATDILSVIVWDHPELVLPNLTYTIGPTGASLQGGAGLAAQSLPGFVVDANGFIQFPYVDFLKVGGLTEAEVKTRLRELLSKYVQNPQITVRVVGYRSKKVYVDGQVRSAGVKPITDTPMTLAEALSQAGGITDAGDPSGVTLVRGSKIYVLSLTAMARDGVSSAQIPLQDNDIIRVSPLVDRHVFVMGEVGKQSSVPFKVSGDLNLGDALSAVEGMSPTTSDPTEIYVIRTQKLADNPIVYHLNGKSPTGLALASSFPLQPNDLVYVDAPGVVRWNRVVTQLLGGTTAAYYLQRTVSP
jgi:polysaccharide export outer membrane protein